MNDLSQFAVRWAEHAVLVGQIALIVSIAGVARWLVRRIVRRIGARYDLPRSMVSGAGRVATFLIGCVAAAMVLDRLGVSASVLWTAFTGFAAVAAVAFFAAWSVLSNIFCALLIFTTRPFRLFDEIELVENGEKPGLRGRVIGINLIYTTLQEPSGALLQIPNSLFFQRTTRCWRGHTPAMPATAAARERELV